MILSKLSKVIFSLLSILFLLSASIFAQNENNTDTNAAINGTVQVLKNNADINYIGYDDLCQDEKLEVKFTYLLNDSTNFQIKLFLKDKCPSTQKSGTAIVSNGTVDLSSLLTNSKSLCQNNNNNITNSYIICAYKNSNDDSVESNLVLGAYKKIPINTWKPIIDKAKLLSQDSKISILLDSILPNVTYEICYEKCDDDKCSSPISEDNQCSGTIANKSDLTFKDNQITLSGLKNDQSYTIAIRGILTNFNNQGKWHSISDKIKPQEEYTPMNLYDGPKNPWSTSCENPVDAPTAAAFGFLGFKWYRRKKKSVNSKIFKKFFTLILPILILLFLSTNSLANSSNMSISLDIGPYQPAIDSTLKENSNQTINPIYKCFFNDSTLALFGLSVDSHLTSEFGSLKLGLGARYALASDKAILNPDDCSKKGNDKIALHILQFRPQLTYALDQWVETVPIAPYLRAAVIGNVYMFTLNGKLDSSGVGKENNPAGLRLGYEFAAGLLFLLDILEPQTAQSARFSGDYQHTYLKAEISYTNINGFSKPGMNFSPKGILGLNWPLMLTFGLVIEV